MGRIKTAFVKRITHDLMHEYGAQMTDNFQQNKEKVNTLIIGSSKKIRNIIAGYVTRLKKSKEFSS